MLIAYPKLEADTRRPFKFLTKTSGPTGDYGPPGSIPPPVGRFSNIVSLDRGPHPLFRTSQTLRTYRGSKPQRLWKKVFTVLHAVIRFHEAAHAHGMSRGLRRWKKVFNILHALMALHEAAHRYSSGKGSNTPLFQIFDSRMEHVRKRRRSFSKAEREQIAEIRKTGACSDCREKHRKVSLTG